MSTKLESQGAWNETELEPRNSLISSIPIPQPFPTAPVQEIWVGYISTRCSHLDKQSKEPTTELQLRALSKHIQAQSSYTEIFTKRWICCQVPIILIGELDTTSAGAMEQHVFPCSVQFKNLEAHPALTAGFSGRGQPRCSVRLFYENSDFDVTGGLVATTRKVLCVGYVLDKRRLVWPLAVSIGIAIISIIITGAATCDVATSAQVGAFVAAVVGLLWSFVMWALS